MEQNPGRSSTYLPSTGTHQTDVVANQGVLPVPAEGQFVTLEDGIQVSFSIDPAGKDGEFHVGDYWVFAASTADASVEELKSAPPSGNHHHHHHHYCRLALAEFDGTRWNVLTDCRNVFPPLTELLYMANQSPLTFEAPTSLINAARSSFPKPKSVANFVLQIADFGG